MPDLMSLPLLGFSTLMACLLALRPLLCGPRDADRIIALDIFLVAAVALCLLASLLSRQSVYLDVALILVIIGFVATLGWARLIEADEP